MTSVSRAKICGIALLCLALIGRYAEADPSAFGDLDVRSPSHSFSEVSRFYWPSEIETLSTGGGLFSSSEPPLVYDPARLAGLEETVIKTDFSDLQLVTVSEYGFKDAAILTLKAAWNPRILDGVKTGSIAPVGKVSSLTNKELADWYTDQGFAESEIYGTLSVGLNYEKEILASAPLVCNVNFCTSDLTGEIRSFADLPVSAVFITSDGSILDTYGGRRVKIKSVEANNIDGLKNFGLGGQIRLQF